MGWAFVPPCWLAAVARQPGAGGTSAESTVKTSGDDRLVGAFITDTYLVFPAAEEGDDRPLEEREREICHH